MVGAAAGLDAAESSFSLASLESVSVWRAAAGFLATREEAAESVGGVGGGGESGLGCWPSEGAGDWMSSTGLFYGITKELQIISYSMKMSHMTSITLLFFLI